MSTTVRRRAARGIAGAALVAVVIAVLAAGLYATVLTFGGSHASLGGLGAGATGRYPVAAE